MQLHRIAIEHLFSLGGWYLINYLNVHNKLEKLSNFSSTKHFYVVI